MKKKIIAVFLAGVLAATALAGCSGKEAAKNGELNIYVWTEYVPDSVIEKFEEEYDIDVNMTTYSSNEDMLAKVKAEADGAYDIVQPSDYMVSQMVSQDLLKKVDYASMENYSNIGEQYLDPSYDPGNQYSVPYLGGAGAIAVNTSMVDIEIDSYADLFDESLKGELLVLDDFRAVVGMVAKSMGYSMNETDPDVLAEIEEKVLELKDNIVIYDSDSPKSSLISGDCAVAFCWSAEIALAQEENSDIECVYPSEGPYLFMDNWCITKAAKNSENAEKFINFMMDPEVAKMVAEEFPYLNPNVTAVADMGSEYSENIAKNPPASALENGEFVENIDTDAIAIYDDIWTKLKQ